MTTIMDERAPERAKPGVRVLLRVMLLVGDQPYTLGDAEVPCDMPALRSWLSLAPSPGITPPLPPANVTTELRQRLATLCNRLGVAEPAYDQLGEPEATMLLAQLQAEEEELLQTAEQMPPPQPAARSAPLIEKALIRQLKERWRACFCPQGTVDDLRRDWEHFKQRVCGQAVSDRTMSANQYEQLLAALAKAATEREPS